MCRYFRIQIKVKLLLLPRNARKTVSDQTKKRYLCCTLAMGFFVSSRMARIGDSVFEDSESFRSACSVVSAYATLWYKEILTNEELY